MIWQWNFRIGFTPREGLVIYSVAYMDDSRGRRPVAHRLSYVEMAVSYRGWLININLVINYRLVIV